MIAHCLFEQTGTFKNAFINHGINAFDYDIRNDFKQTDFVIDLFGEIEHAYKNHKSIFDNISKDDLIIAFFPCTRFENQIMLGFRGDQYQQKNSTLKDKLMYDLKLMDELKSLYELITKMVIVCINNDLRLIIENPYSKEHFLTRYWAFKSKLIDKDRTINGDHFKKPTQYWFLNFEPKQNIVFETFEQPNIFTIVNTHDQVKRSTISKTYAERFIKQFILEE